ncbi:DUF3852 family protein [Anaerotignum lactatifermentans]
MTRRRALSLHKKHGEFDFAPVAILFFGLVFALTAPLYIWDIIGI